MNKTTVTITSLRTDGFTYNVEVSTGEPMDMLEEAFAITNRDDRPLGRKVCSTSVGDLLAIGERCWVVEPDGFAEISAEEAARWKRTSSRDAIMGFNYCRNHNLIAA